MNSPVIRRQATLFLRGNEAVDAVRREFNPKQARLIGSHVTLIREDEVSDWVELRTRIAGLELRPIKLKFGQPERDGDLVLVRCRVPAAFDRLREQLLELPRRHGAHVTRIHPRNGVCTDADFEIISSRIQPFEHIFDEITFIRQAPGGVWETVERFQMRGPRDSD
ncbi:MAG: hypothetical protein IPN69_22275 [Acidobacteria bacterium]|nr:hypothetical protein [Acidobacteriota bacterium]